MPEASGCFQTSFKTVLKQAFLNASFKNMFCNLRKCGFCLQKSRLPNGARGPQAAPKRAEKTARLGAAGHSYRPFGSREKLRKASADGEGVQRRKGRRREVGRRRGGSSGGEEGSPADTHTRTKHNTRTHNTTHTHNTHNVHIKKKIGLRRTWPK